MAEKIKLTLRQNSGSQFDVEVDPTATIKELKQACQDGAGMPADEMRLIFKGKILKDEQTLTDYKIENGCTIHLVKGKGGSSSTSGTSSESNANVSGGIGTNTSGTSS